MSYSFYHRILFNYVEAWWVTGTARHEFWCGVLHVCLWWCTSVCVCLCILMCRINGYLGLMQLGVCFPGIPFMQVEASDRDERNTPHAELRFSLMDQTPRIPTSQMFQIDAETGEVSLTEEGQYLNLLSITSLHTQIRFVLAFIWVFSAFIYQLFKSLYCLHSLVYKAVVEEVLELST